MPKEVKPEDLDLELDPTEPAQPPAKPGDKDYDWAAQYGTDDLYVHTFSDGTVVALKSFTSIYSKTWLYKIRTMQSDVDIEFAAIDRGGCPAVKEVLLTLDDSKGDPLDELFRAWAASVNKGITPGE